MKFTLIAAAVVASGSLVSAQTNEPPAVIQITREVVKEGKGAAHRRAEQDYANAFRKNKYPFNYLGLNTMSGPNEAWFLSAYPSFAAMEESDKVSQKAPLKNDLELVEARDGELRSQSRTMTVVFRKDLSYIPANPTPLAKFRYMMIDTYRVRLGQNEGFLQSGKAILAGYAKANIEEEILCYQVIAGAPNGVYLFLIPMASLNQMDNARANNKALSDALGADNLSRITKGEGEVFQTMESTLFAVSPEMSYMSKETEDADPAFWRPKMATRAKAPEKTDKP